MTSILDELATRSNDYSDIEPRYRSLGLGSLSAPPIACPPPPTLSPPPTTIVIPCWNAASTLERCFEAIERSSFNRRHPERLTVIAVDDGSSDATWELLRNASPAFQLIAVRQDRGSRAVAMNTGLAFAEGDFVVSLDSDVILPPHALEHLVAAHVAAPHDCICGFRAEVAPARAASLGAMTASEPTTLLDDRRVRYELRGVSMKKQVLDRVADGAAGVAGLRVYAHVADDLLHVARGGVDVEVAVAGEMFEDGDRRFLGDGADQRFAAARDD